MFHVTHSIGIFKVVQTDRREWFGKGVDRTFVVTLLIHPMNANISYKSDLSIRTIRECIFVLIKYRAMKIVSNSSCVSWISTWKHFTDCARYSSKWSERTMLISFSRLDATKPTRLMIFCVFRWQSQLCSFEDTFTRDNARLSCLINMDVVTTNVEWKWSDMIASISQLLTLHVIRHASSVRPHMRHLTDTFLLALSRRRSKRFQSWGQ